MKRKILTENKNSIKVLIFMIPFLMGIGIDLYVPSLPTITKFYDTSVSLVQISISIYMFGYGIGQIFFGVLSDSYGRRIFLKMCSLVFVFASIFAIVSVNIYWLNICRLIQGLGVAGLAVVARAMIVDVFKGKDLYKMTNYFGLSWSAGPILGPFIGSYLQYFFGWKANFYFFSIYGIMLCIYAFFKVPETNVYNVKIESSIYNIKLILLNRIFILITAIAGINYGIIVFFNVEGPFLIQIILKYSINEYGYIALLLGLSYFVGSVVNRILLRSFKGTILLIIGIYGAIIFSIIMIILANIFYINLVIIVIPVTGIFFFGGFVVPNSLAKTMSIFPKLAGTASSVFGTLTGIIVSLISYIVSNISITSQLLMSWSFFILLILSIILCYLSKVYEKGNKNEK